MPGRVRLKFRDRGSDGREGAKQFFRDQLMELVKQPFIPGALRIVNPRGNALSIRHGGKVETLYVPRANLKEVRELTDRYRTARELLAKIARIELGQFKKRMASAKKARARGGA